MAKSENQKLKMLYLREKFIRDTDENNGITVNEMIEYLAKNGISAERKSLYTDIEALNLFGMDIVMDKVDRKAYYKLVSREFELAELKLLVDAVQASKFITANKTNKLIKKIEGLASSNEAKELQRQVYVLNRVKNVNEKIYILVDSIHSAINSGKQIKFIYSYWNVNKELVPKKNGEYYNVSPWALTWDDENYYLIAYDEIDKKIKHYRVDKMSQISVLDVERNGKELFDGFDIATYSNKTFGMYGGKEELVKLRFDSDMIGVVLDRFGSDIMVHPDMDNTHFYVNIPIAISNQFFGWIVGLGNKVKIAGPTEVVDAFKEYLLDIKKNYD